MRPILNTVKFQLLTLLATMLLCCGVANAQQAVGIIAERNLPVAAQKTLQLIKQNGPFPYAKDGAVFGNYEKILPKQRRGYYHEYTVKAKGGRNRGALRIVAGGDPAVSGEYYFTDDHYATFKRIQN